MGSENTSHRSNLCGKEIMIISKILSEMEKMSSTEILTLINQYWGEICRNSLRIPCLLLLPACKHSSQGHGQEVAQAAGVRSLWQDCIVSVKKKNFWSLLAALALPLINKGNSTPSPCYTKCVQQQGLCCVFKGTDTPEKVLSVCCSPRSYHMHWSTAGCGRKSSFGSEILLGWETELTFRG